MKRRPAHVYRRAFQRGHGSIQRGQVHLRHLGFETLRRDAVDRARQRLIAIRVAAHARIEPVAHVDRAIRTHHHIGRPEMGFEVVAHPAALEVRAREFPFLVGSEEVEALHLEARAVRLREVTEHCVATRLAGEEHAAILLPERAVLVERHARRRTTAINVTGRGRAGILLPPLRGRGVLTGPAIRAPTALAVERAEAHVRVLHQPRRPARRRIVVVGVEDIAKGGHRLFVAVAEVVPDDVNTRAIWIHARREAPDVHVPVVALLPGDLARIPAEVTGIGPAVVRIVIAADAKRLAGLVREHRAAIARIPIPLSVGSDRDRVQRMIVDTAIESGQQHLALVHGGVELQVPIHIGIDDQVRRHRNDDLVVDNRDAHWRAEKRLLDEHPAFVRLAVAIRVFEHHDAVALGLALVVAPVIHALGHPDTAILVRVDVGGVLEHRRRRPERDLQIGQRVQHLDRNESGLRMKDNWRPDGQAKTKANQGKCAHDGFESVPRVYARFHQGDKPKSPTGRRCGVKLKMGFSCATHFGKLTASTVLPNPFRHGD